MAKPIMIQGTMSNAGKSLLTAGLLRILKQDGYRVAPFKSQNMALNSFITEDGLEMGRAQVVQAEAAGIKPSVQMNPILLKPTNDIGSQVIVNGEVIGNMGAAEYFRYKTTLIPQILEAYHHLDQEYDIIVIEGAGSPAEINLKTDDIVNMGLAKLIQAPVLLAGDIDRGGVFAQLVGTMLLLPAEEQKMVKGLIINKFRGDKSLLAPGLDMLKQYIQTETLGVVPYMHLDIDDEDSLSTRFSSSAAIPGQAVDIAVIRLPHISNFTDFAPLERVPGVSLRYVSSLGSLDNPDMIILPGTKNTIDDLKWLRQSGLEAAILKAASRDTIIFGICGGFQMLGSQLYDPDNLEGGGSIHGTGLLPMETTFQGKKVRTQVAGRIKALSGPLSRLNGQPYKGYEIHMGRSCFQSPLTGKPDVIVNKGHVYGSYIHGIFDETLLSKALVTALYQKKGLEFQPHDIIDTVEYKNRQYDLLADGMRASLNMPAIYKIIESGL